MKEIPLTKGKVTLVDDADYAWLLQQRWRFRSGYARSDKTSMHRLIMNAPRDMEVDHINGDTLDNRRKNLRLATVKQNRMNRSKHKITSSQYKGVSWEKRSSKWRARIKLNRKFIYLGIFASEIDAANAYDKAAHIYHGEFARANF